MHGGKYYIQCDQSEVGSTVEHLKVLTGMMRLDEGNGLLETNTTPKVNTIDSCLDNPKDGAVLGIALSLAMGNAADAVEIMCVGFILSEMSDISSFQKEFLSAAVFMGMLFGGIICGYASDVVGRRPCLLYSLGLNLLAGLASAAAPNVDVLIACRVIGGLGIGGSVPIVFSMGAEIFPSHVRGQYLSVIASFWMVGAVFTAFSAWIMLGSDFYGHKMMPGVNWRAFALVSALPAILAMFLTHRNIPESPRFLVSKKRYAEAAVVINQISSLRIEAADLEPHDGMDVPFKVEIDAVETGSPVQDRQSDYHPIDLNSSHGNSFRTNSTDSTISHALKQSTIGLLFQGELLRTSLILLVIWFTLSFGSYGLSTWISTLFADVGIGNPYAAAFIFALANLPGNIVSLLYIEKYGRRVLLSAGMCLAGASALGFALNTADAFVVVLCAALFNAFSVIGWNSLDCLSGMPYVPCSRVHCCAAARFCV